MYVRRRVSVCVYIKGRGKSRDLSDEDKSRNGKNEENGFYSLVDWMTWLEQQSATVV